MGEYPTYQEGDSSKYRIQNIMLRFDYNGNLIFQKKIIEPDSTILKIYAYPSIKKNDSIYFFHLLYYKNEFTWLRRVIFEINIRNGEILKSKHLPKYEEFDYYSMGGGYYESSSGSLVFPTAANLANGNEDILFVFELDSNLNVVNKLKYEYPGYDLFIYKAVNVTQKGKLGFTGTMQRIISKYYQKFPVFIQIDSNFQLSSVVVRKDLEKFIYRAENFSPTVDEDGNWVVLMSKDTIENRPDSNSLNAVPYIMKFSPRGDSMMWSCKFQHPHFQFNGFFYFHFAMGRCTDGSGYIAMEMISRGTQDSTAYIRMFKASERGDSLWSRNLYILGPEEKTWYSELNPIVATPFNSFVTQGSAGIDRTGQFRPWLVHFDYHGCIIPGCHLSVSVEEEEEKIVPVLEVYPNPATGNELYVLSRAGEGQSGLLELRDLNGLIIYQQRMELHRGAQYMVMLPEGLSAGVYVLQWQDGLRNFNTKVNIVR
ncbi:MAG: T9SS type A sorting domain-containing protein [Saprospiraceae bacterium]|nr:T9SS type A sorting domain-containing protein [Saprospiraceae bacterium]